MLAFKTVCYQCALIYSFGSWPALAVNENVVIVSRQTSVISHGHSLTDGARKAIFIIDYSMGVDWWGTGDGGRGVEGGGGGGGDISPHFSQRGGGGQHRTCPPPPPPPPPNLFAYIKRETHVGLAIVRLSTLFLLSVLLFFAENMLGPEPHSEGLQLQRSLTPALTRCLRAPFGGLTVTTLPDASTDALPPSPIRRAYSYNAP